MHFIDEMKDGIWRTRTGAGSQIQVTKETKVNGWMVPTSPQLEKLSQAFLDTPKSRVGLETLGVGSRVLKRELDWISSGEWWELASKLGANFTSPQAKNFCVALMTSMQLEKGAVARVAVIGSKASEGGGLWHSRFMAWIITRYNNVVVDFWDPNEIAEVRLWKEGDREGREQHIASEYHGDGAEYDILIDDIFVSGQGVSTKDWKSTVWSRKVQDGLPRENLLPNFFSCVGGARVFDFFFRSRVNLGAVFVYIMSTFVMVRGYSVRV